MKVLIQCIIVGFTMLFSVSLLAEGGSMIGGGDEIFCSKNMAIAKATEAVKTLAKLNFYENPENPTLFNVKEFEDTFQIILYYSYPLTAPGWEVKIYKNKCLMGDLIYINLEG